MPPKKTVSKPKKRRFVKKTPQPDKKTADKKPKKQPISLTTKIRSLLHRLQGEYSASLYAGMSRRPAEGRVAQPRMKKPRASVLGEASFLAKSMSFSGFLKKLFDFNLVNYLKRLDIFRFLSPFKPLWPYLIPFFLLLFAIIIFFSLLVPKNNFQLAKDNLAVHQYNLDKHLFLAEEFLKNNQIEEAEKELVLAQYINTNDSRVKNLWQRKMENNPNEIPKLIDGWEKILALRPGYRDGHLRLAILYFKTDEPEIARFHLQEAINLDPNFEPARELEGLINNESK